MSDTAEPGFIPDFRAILALAQKEFLDSVRSKWILVLGGLFLSLTLIFSYFGAASSGETGFSGFASTAGAMQGTVTIFLPIMCLMLAYASIAGEREQGSLQLLLSYPITRTEVVLGKVIGLGAVASAAIIGGLGISAIIVAAAAGTDHWESFLMVLGAAVLFALAFVAVGVFFSSLTKKRSTALGVAIFLWFFFFLIYQLLLFGLLVASGGFDPGAGPPGSLALPDWFYMAEMFNPGQSFGYFAALAFANPGQQSSLPGFVTMGSTVLVLVLWTVIPTALAILGLRRKDL